VYRQECNATVCEVQDDMLSDAGIYKLQLKSRSGAKNAWLSADDEPVRDRVELCALTPPQSDRSLPAEQCLLVLH
jgi:hypothetical protein